MCVRTRAVPTESVSQLLFRPAGACSRSTSYPRLMPWAAFLRRLAAQHSIGGPLFGRLSSYDTDSYRTRFHRWELTQDLRPFGKLRAGSGLSHAAPSGLAFAELTASPWSSRFG